MIWSKVKVGDFLIRVKDLVEIIDNEEYKLITIRLYHKGVKLRKQVNGSEFQAQKMSRVKAGQFILSGIDARNGAFGIVPNELDGGVVTNDFWHFDIDTNVISTEYFLWLTSTPYFDDICKKASDGTTNRIRLQADRFYSQEIMIPSIEYQHTVVDKLQNTNGKIKRLGVEYNFQHTQLENLNQAILQEAVQGKLVPQDSNDEPASILLKRIKTEKSKSGKKEKPLPPIKPEEIPFAIPESWVWCRLGEITNYGSSPKAEPSDLKNDTWVLDLEDIEKTTSKLLCKIRFCERNSLSTKSVFKKGDVLYSKLRPYLDKVIVAEEDGVCTTEILPLKCFGGLNPFYLKYSLKRSDFLKYVSSVTKGMKMPRLGTKEGQMALIPLSPICEQKRIVAEIERQFEKTKQLKEHIIANKQATEQLLKALLHGAFEVEEKKETKTVSFVSRKSNLSERTVLAAYLIKQFNSEGFGRVMLMKLLFLVEYICKIDFESHYVVNVAGPYDDLIKEIEIKLRTHKLYNAKQNKLDNHVHYQEMTEVDQVDELFESTFAAESELINQLIRKFKKSTWDQCEIVATMYAVWNNRIKSERTINDMALKQDFLNWDPQKLKYKDRLDAALDWMRTKEIVPDGWGKLVERPES